MGRIRESILAARFVQDGTVAGFDRLPAVSRNTLADRTRLGAFLEYLSLACSAGHSSLATGFLEAALRASIITWNLTAYNATLQVAKRLAVHVPSWRPLVWHYEGWHHFSNGDVQFAIETYERCISSWEMLGRLADAAEARIAMARIYHSSGQWDKALCTYRESLDPLLAAGRHRAAAFAIQSVADILLHRLELSEAEKHHAQALELLSLIDDTSIGYGQATTLRNLGNVYRVRGDWSVAIKYYERSVQQAKEQNNESDLAHTLNCMATVYLQIGEWSTAELHFRKSIAIHTGINDRTWVALDYRGLGVLAMLQGKLDEALSYLSQAADLLEDTGVRHHLASVLAKKALVYVQNEEYDLASSLIEESRNLISGLGDVRLAALLNETEGWLQFGRGDMELAQQLFTDSLGTFTQAGIKLKQSDLLFALGSVQERLNNQPEALRLFSKAASLVKQVDCRQTELAAMTAQRLHVSAGRQSDL